MKNNKKAIAALIMGLSGLFASETAVQAGQLASLTAQYKAAEAGNSDPVKTASVSHASNRQITAKSANSPGVFGSVALPIGKLPALKMFASAWNEISANSGRAIVSKASYLPQPSLRDRMIAINASVNRSIRYQSDATLYGAADHWATPDETLSNGKGDCEDFAILKMALLAKEGVALSDMALVVVFDQGRGLYHAVLDVRAGGRHFILDNLHEAVLSDQQLPNYLPLYSIVNGRAYFHGQPRSNVNLAAYANGIQPEQIHTAEGSAG
ncbi:transglutaminase-like cysteine peptidase [Rhizobium sp. L1K21]|uniref:transglutaminase-like cysteine peptidase n=1 Tax=Rhizobium sp. L1K21 TaxID=2954933 RepID=UPI00209219BB|nr:transglutaminase-like cysteine peptidase [Rhizobium sp. L1K21]MCO6187040.1 transglutaminase-like cysteine peptidase [Rhizobium sp. L1K21]